MDTRDTAIATADDTERGVVTGPGWRDGPRSVSTGQERPEPRANRGVSAVRRVASTVVPALLVVVAVLAGVLSYSSTRAETYTSEAVVTFSPRVDRSVGADTLQVLAAKYVSFLASPATQQRIAEDVGIDAAIVRDALDVEIPPATVSLTVSVTLPDPVRATVLANALSAAAARESIDDVNLRGEILAPAIVPFEPDGPSRALINAIGLAVALVAGLLALLLFERLLAPRPA